MTLLECVQDACLQVGQTNAAMIAYAKKKAARRYRFIWDAALWQDSQLPIGFVAPAASAEVIMPTIIERIISVRIDRQNVTNVQLGSIFQLDPTLFEKIGQPLNYANLSEIGTADTPNGSTLTIFSDSAADAGKKVLIRGQRNGSLYREVVALNGVTPVVTANAYDIVETFTKEETIGNVIVRRTADNGALLTLWPEESERKHPRIRLFQIPATAPTLLVLGKRRPTPLTNDLDTPAIRGIDNAWLAFVVGDLLEKQRQYGKAQAKFAEAQGLVQGMADGETNQGAFFAQVIPEPYEGGDYDDGYSK